MSCYDCFQVPTIKVRRRYGRELESNCYMVSVSFIQRLVLMHTRCAGGLTFLVVYGHQVKSNDDSFLNLAEECVDILATLIASGRGIWPVDGWVHHYSARQLQVTGHSNYPRTSALCSWHIRGG
jgi:hypothetical protein